MSINLDEKWKRFYWKELYRKGWGIEINPDQTKKEVEGVLEILNPTSGAHILDWCGGWGRHSIELAERGFNVTLLDFTPAHIKMAEVLAEEAGVGLNLVQADFRETPANIQADFAINMFTAGIGHYTREDDTKALTSLYKALKPGAKFLVDTMNLYWLVKNYQPRGWRESDDKKIRLFGKREFDFWTGRNISEETLAIVSQEEQTMTLDILVYTPAELAVVFREAGFVPIKLYGGFDGQKFSFDSRRIIMVSEKPE